MSQIVVHAVRPPRPVLNPLGAAILLAGLLALAGAWLASPSSAGARLVWCAGDPIVRINDEHDVSVTVHVPVDELDKVSGATVVFHVPSNVDAEVTFVDSTYFPEDVAIAYDLPEWDGRGALRVVASITVHADEDINVAASVEDARAGTSWKHATANSTFEVTTIAATGGRGS